jgi:hypothetical protein
VPPADVPLSRAREHTPVSVSARNRSSRSGRSNIIEGFPFGASNAKRAPEAAPLDYTPMRRVNGGFAMARERYLPRAVPPPPPPPCVSRGVRTARRSGTPAARLVPPHPPRGGYQRPFCVHGCKLRCCCRRRRRAPAPAPAPPRSLAGEAAAVERRERLAAQAGPAAPRGGARARARRRWRRRVAWRAWAGVDRSGREWTGEKWVRGWSSEWAPAPSPATHPRPSLPW